MEEWPSEWEYHQREDLFSSNRIQPMNLGSTSRKTSGVATGKVVGFTNKHGGFTSIGDEVDPTKLGYQHKLANIGDLPVKKWVKHNNNNNSRNIIANT